MRRHPLALGIPALLTAAPIAAAAPPVSGSFVGAVPGSGLYVAVVAAPGPEGSARAVRVYACDGRAGRAATVSEWFPGRGGDAFALASESGRARVRVTLGAGAASGVLSLPGGRELAFRAPRARGVAGLYEATTFPDGRIRGVSATGIRQEGVLTRRRDAAGLLVARGTYLLPGGRRVPWRSSTGVRLARRPAASRVIVLPDGSRRGAFKRRVFVVVAGSSQPPN